MVVFVCRGGKHRSEACSLLARGALQFLGAEAHMSNLTGRECDVDMNCQSCYNSDDTEEVRGMIKKTAMYFVTDDLVEEVAPSQRESRATVAGNVVLTPGVKRPELAEARPKQAVWRGSVLMKPQEKAKPKAAAVIDSSDEEALNEARRKKGEREIKDIQKKAGTLKREVKVR